MYGHSVPKLNSSPCLPRVSTRKKFPNQHAPMSNHLKYQSTIIFFYSSYFLNTCMNVAKTIYHEGTNSNDHSIHLLNNEFNQSPSCLNQIACYMQSLFWNSILFSHSFSAVCKLFIKQPTITSIKQLAELEKQVGHKHQTSILYFIEPAWPNSNKNFLKFYKNKYKTARWQKCCL